jgi:hypothetical protein
MAACSRVLVTLPAVDAKVNPWPPGRSRRVLSALARAVQRSAEARRTDGEKYMTVVDEALEPAPPDTLDDPRLENLLRRFGEALSAGDVQGVARCWAVPALILDGPAALAATSAAEIENAFRHAIDWYRSRGLVSTRPKLERAARLSDHVAAVDVRWPAFDARGVERMSERSHYLVQIGDDGQPRIRVALSRG